MERKMIKLICLDRRKCGPNGVMAKPFLCCIIDDASNCTEPQSLMPLALGMNKLVLVGDTELKLMKLNSPVIYSRCYTVEIIR